MKSGPNEPARKLENVIAKQSSNSTISRRESAGRSSGDESKVVESKGASPSGERTVEESVSSSEVLDAEVHGCTRKSVRDANNRCTFNQLFELNFEFDRVGQETQPSGPDPNGARPDRTRDRTVLGDQTNLSDRVANDSRDRRSEREQSDSGRSGDDRATTDGDRIESDKSSRSGERDAKNASRTDPPLLEWPYFELRVWSVDQWKRKTFVGLALLGLPRKPGQYTENVDIWSLTSNQPKAKLMQYFLGYSLEPKSRLTVRLLY